MNFNVIDNLEDLSYLNKELLNKPFVALDTEFRRTTKANMRLALLQINDLEEIFLVDTVAIHSPFEQCSFLYSDSVMKIIHSCKEDIEAIHSWTGRVLANIYDTQLAEAFLGGEFSISYQKAVKELLDIEIDKGETRSNWIRRPLSDSQLNYAASDVEFLIDLYLQQIEKLDKRKLNWLKEDIDSLLKNTFSDEVIFPGKESNLPRSKELTILKSFDKLIRAISDEFNLNSTLFFSKRSQKDFIRKLALQGKEEAYKDLTSWRKELIDPHIDSLIDEF